MFDRLLDKCLLRHSLQKDRVWNCDTWLVQFCEARGITMRYLRLYAIIERLSNIEDDFHTYHDQWSQHVKNAEQLLPNSIFVMGNEDEKHASQWSNITAGLPGSAFANTGCNLVADSQYCVHKNLGRVLGSFISFCRCPVRNQTSGTWFSIGFKARCRNAYLIHLRLAIYLPAANRQRQIKFGLFRTYSRNIKFRGRRSRFHANASAFWPLLTLPYNLLEISRGQHSENAGISYNLFRPVLMRRGDCIFWTSCAEDESDEDGLPEPGGQVASRCLIRRDVSPTYTRSSEPIKSFQPIISRYHSAAFTFFKQVPPL